MDCSMSKKTKLEVIQKIEALMLGGGNYKNNRADMDEGKEDFIYKVAMVKRLPKTSKERFLKRALQNRIQDERDGYYALLNILCFKWGEGTPERQRAEYIMREGGKSWDVISVYFAYCLSDGVFADGDFFLETLLALYKKTASSLPADFQVSSNGACVLLNLLLTSLGKSFENSAEAGEILKFHKRLIDGPLKYFINNPVPGDSSVCKTLQNKYLALLGATQAQEHESGKCNYTNMGEVVI